MIQIGRAILSLDVIEKQFVCDLEKCKGICCVEGDSGAPLTKKETKILKKIYKKVKPFMTREGILEIERQGTHISDFEGDDVTPLVNNKECAYVTYKDGITICAIEKAYLAGKVKFKKPISCHLYPIRITEYAEIDAVLPSKNIGDIAVTSSKIYISDSGLHKIWILDKYTFDFTHEREVKNYKGSFPDKQFLFEDMEKIYILDSMLPSVSIIDIQTDTINKYIDLDDHYPIDLITAGSYAYVIFRRHNEIGVINIVDDLLEGYIKSTEEIKYIENITDVKVIVDNNNNGYIVDRYGRRIIRFSQSEKKYISEIPIFGNPLDLTLSENEEKLIVSFYSQEATRDTLIIMDPF